MATRINVSAPNYLAWREANHVFGEMAAADEYRTVSLTAQAQLATAAQPERDPSSGRVSQLFHRSGESLRNWGAPSPTVKTSPAAAMSCYSATNSGSGTSDPTLR